MVRSLWQKSGRLKACPTKAHNSLSHNGGAGGFACESLVEILLPQAVRLIVSALLVCALATAGDRMEWFRQDKFGMFIHWGPYSVLAGEWNDQRIPVGTEAEWIMQRFNIPLRQYRAMARGFNPQKFNAAEIVDLARRTGMKYLVVTAKHHDGFAMYRSRVSDYNIVDWTAFKRDPVDELSRECRKAGIRFCVYYSQREDWDHPDGYGNNWDYDRSRKNFVRYLEEKSKPQLRELLTGYGPLGLVWFDRGMDTPEQASDLVNLVHSLQPACLINGRVGNYGQDLMGDYQDMNDNGMPAGGLDEYWETPQTLNTTWGYSKFDDQWKTPELVIRRLVEIVSKGGNYLLNIGPMGDGTIPAPSVAVLNQVGEWMQRNGESIYGTTACPVDFPWGRCTVKQNRLYLHVFSKPGDGVLRLSRVRNEVRMAYPLAEPQRKLRVTGTSISLPSGSGDAADTVIVAELAGILQTDPVILTQGSDVGFDLDYMNAVTSGRAAKRFNREGKFHIAKWTGPEDTATWQLLVSQAGPYRVTIRYAARSGAAGARYAVAIGPKVLDGSVQETGAWYAYKDFDLGTVAIEKAGRYAVTIHPLKSGAHLMYLQSVRLEPVGVPRAVE
jgi:alpha-L-fucosidase